MHEVSRSTKVARIDSVQSHVEAKLTGFPGHRSCYAAFAALDGDGDGLVDAGAFERALLHEDGRGPVSEDELEAKLVDAAPDAAAGVDFTQYCRATLRGRPPGDS